MLMSACLKWTLETQTRLPSSSTFGYMLASDAKPDYGNLGQEACWSWRVTWGMLASSMGLGLEGMEMAYLLPSRETDGFLIIVFGELPLGRMCVISNFTLGCGSSATKSIPVSVPFSVILKSVCTWSGVGRRRYFFQRGRFHATPTLSHNPPSLTTALSQTTLSHNPPSLTTHLARHPW